MKKVLFAGLVAVPLIGVAKKRRILRYLSGKTEVEAREMILAKATPRFGAEKAGHIADQIVARLAADGRLAQLSSPGTRTTLWFRYLHDTPCGVRKRR